MAISLNDIQEENHTQADEMRHLHQALEAEHQSQAELQQQPQQSAQRLETESLKGRQQRQQLMEHLNESDQVNSQLSQWQGSLQKSTKKLSAALNNKIRQQQS
ncbi:uncharacterized protein [Asterias amurensis]|uniref:uncharacterized protein n=1 Tax=Asterias amurensis TaxID=7602 RepID=UPI003AB7240A